MNKTRQRCSCGRGKESNQCCGKTTSEIKLELERAARRFSDVGMHVEASEVLEKRVSLSPKNPMIWNDLGVQRAAAGQLSAAEVAFRRANKVLPEYPVALYNLGKLSLDQCLQLQILRKQKPEDQIHGLASEAAGYLQSSLTQDPSLTCAHELLHKVFAILGDKQKATSHLSRALNLNPELRTFYSRPWLERLPLIGHIFIKTEYRGPDFLSSR